MTPSNGNHVTWRELSLALEPIKEDVSEIKEDVKALRNHDDDTWLGPKGAGLLSAVVGGLLITLFSTGLSVAVVYLT